MTVTTDGMPESVTIENVTSSVCDYAFYQSNVLEWGMHEVNVTVTDAWWLMLERIEVDEATHNMGYHGSVFLPPAPIEQQS
jgi:hypothetical protein